MSSVAKIVFLLLPIATERLSRSFDQERWRTSRASIPGGTAVLKNDHLRELRNDYCECPTNWSSDPCSHSYSSGHSSSRSVVQCWGMREPKAKYGREPSLMHFGTTCGEKYPGFCWFYDAKRDLWNSWSSTWHVAYTSRKLILVIRRRKIDYIGHWSGTWPVSHRQARMWSGGWNEVGNGSGWAGIHAADLYPRNRRTLALKNDLL